MQKKNKNQEDKNSGLLERKEQLNQESSTPTSEEEVVAKKKLEVRACVGKGLFEVKYVGGGEQPAALKGQRFTNKEKAQKALDTYNESK